MCMQCQKSPVYEFTNKKKLCKRCFIKYFQKKFFYIIRKFKMIEKGDIVGYFKSDNFRDVVLADVLKMFSEKTMIPLAKLRGSKDFTQIRDFSSKEKIRKIALSSTIDVVADGIIHIIIKNNSSKLKEYLPIQKQKKKMVISPLYLFLDSEVLLYARLKKLKFKEKKDKKDNISRFIDGLEKMHPEVKRAIVNSYLELYS